MTNANVVFVSLLFVLCCARGHAEPVTAASATVIASGSPFWVDSHPEPEDAIINARVDIGSLRQSGDAIEADTAWTLILGRLKDTRAAHPGVVIPDGSTLIETLRIVCRENGMLSYRVANRILSPDGKTLDRQVFNAGEERGRAEDQARAFSEAFPRLSPLYPYAPNAPSLACWAAARKCEGKDYQWPPPPNKAPLEHSERATKMRADYNRLFVPHCQISESR
jgi:hypothetical protein